MPGLLGLVLRATGQASILRSLGSSLFELAGLDFLVLFIASGLFYIVSIRSQGRVVWQDITFVTMGNLARFFQGA